MAGGRVLLAAEFLRGGATLTRLRPLATALAGLGHAVSLAVPVEVAKEVVGFPRFDAPRWGVPPPPGYVAISYADLLMHGGYAAPDALRDLMTGWRGVLEQAAPDLLLVDFAPTAMLAARLAGVKTAAVGDGFSLPPLTAPLPDMRPWAASPPDALDSLEGRILAVVNARLGAERVPGLRHLRDLFAGVTSFLCGFQELDHYPERPDGPWFGAVFPAPVGADAAWPAGDGPRVYVDLDPRHPALPGIVEALDRMGAPALVQGADVAAPGAPEGRLLRVTGSTIRQTLLDGSDVVVCQGLEVVAPALLAGKPVLMLPVFLEQVMTLHRVAAQGLGRGIDPASDTAAIEVALRGLADDRACHLHAANFARAYHGYRPQIAIDAVAGEIGEMLD